MMINRLRSAILSKDAPTVVRILREFDEGERQNARQPLAVMLRELGIVSEYVRLLDCTVTPETARTAAVRTAPVRTAPVRTAPVQRTEGSLIGSERHPPIDDETRAIANLACYGLFRFEECKQIAYVATHEAESAQILADRRPDWFRQWLEDVTAVDVEQPFGRITLSLWCHLYKFGLISPINQGWVRFAFSQCLPQAFASAPEATQRVLSDLAVARQTVYEMPRHPFQLTRAEDWLAALKWLGNRGWFDHQRFLDAVVKMLDQPLDQAERNGCGILLESVSTKPFGCTTETLAQMRVQWVTLLSNTQVRSVRFGLEMLHKLHRAGSLNASAVVGEVPCVFRLGSDGESIQAIGLLGRIALDERLRSQAVSGIVDALSSSSSELQSAAIEQLERYLCADDVQAVSTLRWYVDTVDADLRPRLDNLLKSISDQPQADLELLADEKAYCSRLSELSAQAETLPEAVKERFGVNRQLSAAVEHEIPFDCRWPFTQIHFLATAHQLSPIETVDYLLDFTLKCVESCDCPDSPELIIDAISRLASDRPSMDLETTQTLAAKACVDAWVRPTRGIVGGVLGNAFSRLIGAWLGITQRENAQGDPREYYPMGQFIHQVASLVENGNSYALLSTPTHSGGWIDPRTWVARFESLERNGVKPVESDLVRSLFRLSSDHRLEAWQYVQSIQDGFSWRYHRLLQMALDLSKPATEILLDDSWPVQVWIAAVRSRDPWLDLHQHLSQEDRRKLPTTIWDLPDVLQPAHRQWHAVPIDQSHSQYDRVRTSPMPLDQSITDQVADESQRHRHAREDVAINPLLGPLIEATRPVADDQGFLSAQLHYLRCYPAPTYVYPYLATQWPIKLDWYWSLATEGLSRRVFGGASEEERYDQFLRPLLQSDRPVTLMAARALWIASASEDPNAREMADTVWTAVMDQCRCDLESVTQAWHDVAAGNWMKMDVVAAGLSAVSKASPLHACTVSSIVDSFLCHSQQWPCDVKPLLELLNECNQTVGVAVSSNLAKKLAASDDQAISQVADVLTNRSHRLTEDGRDAILRALQITIDRAQRNADGLTAQVREGVRIHSGSSTPIQKPKKLERVKPRRSSNLERSQRLKK